MEKSKIIKLRVAGNDNGNFYYSYKLPEHTRRENVMEVWKEEKRRTSITQST